MAHRSFGAASDPFTAEASKAAASNPSGVTCSLKIGGDARFQVGERIPVSLSFTSDRPGYKVYVDPGPIFATIDDTFHVDPVEGVRIFPPLTMGGYSGPGPRTAPLSSTSTEVSLTLNDFVRFDRPGVYHVYDASGRVTTGKDVFSPSLPAATQPVIITIVPQDPAWAAEQVKQADRLLGTNPLSNFDAGRFDPANTLRYLGTQDAAREMLNVVSRDMEPGANTVVTQTCVKGLNEFPDRPWLISEMQSDIARPDYTVNQYFLTTLAWNTVWQDNSIPSVELANEKQMQDYKRVMIRLWLDTEAALSSKSKAAVPMTVFSLLEMAWQGLELKGVPEIRKTTLALVRMLPDIFSKLPRRAQEYIVQDDIDWPHVKGRAMLAPLLATWPTIAPPTNNDYDYPDRMLRRIYDLSPSEGRKLVLAEVASEHPRVDEDAISILPNKPLPELDSVLAARLSDKSLESEEVVCRAISRYATKAILPQVKTRYESTEGQWSCAPQASVLVYFLRVDPDYGVEKVKKALDNRKNTGCYHTIFSDIARRGYDPRLLSIARQHQSDPDSEVARDAAKLIYTRAAP